MGAGLVSGSRDEFLRRGVGTMASGFGIPSSDKMAANQQQTLLSHRWAPPLPLSQGQVQKPLSHVCWSGLLSNLILHERRGVRPVIRRALHEMLRISCPWKDGIVRCDTA